jgi:hypothetical protein
MTVFNVDVSEWMEYSARLKNTGPAFRRLRLDWMRYATAQAIANVLFVYENVIMPARSKPTEYTGKYGSTVSRFIAPDGRTGNVTAGGDIDYAERLEMGAGPRTLDASERAEIATWAASKMGITDPKAVRRIIRKIETRGINPGRIFATALNEATPYGRRFHQQVEAEARRLFEQFVQGLG